ncbi:DUF6480 family protein [Streptomyces sp. SP18CS02]|uniref:DUF6480 family protein n=1 Tax=Streptomyces sp. SP18CS02 TaxID=3002531 RepID=UPI002E791454|nr:DUF6480 family protein [Streptomyces sp. SP18CS02]MEE1754571.1 DUF6480 family protein [Streptomyces sp. SP18CS02]
MPNDRKPPGETPPAEGSTAEAHEERHDGGVWEHPMLWVAVIGLVVIFVAAYFVARVFSL